MSNKWLFSLAGMLALLVPQSVPAQSTSMPSTSGGSSTGGSGSGVSNSITNTPIQGPSFGNLGPSTNLAPSMAIGGTGSTTGGVRSPTGPGGTGGTSGTTTPVPTTYNPWANYYTNLYQIGLGSSLTGGSQGQGRTNTASGQFGQPLYSLVTTTPTGTTTGTATTQTQGLGFTTIGMNKAPAYVTALSEDLMIAPPSDNRLQKELRNILNRSSALKGQGTIQLTVKNSQVILKGQVNRDQQRRLAEGLVRMTPGVNEVLNELTVVSGKK